MRHLSSGAVSLPTELRNFVPVPLGVVLSLRLSHNGYGVGQNHRGPVRASA